MNECKKGRRGHIIHNKFTLRNNIKHGTNSMINKHWDSTHIQIQFLLEDVKVGFTFLCIYINECKSSQ